MLSASPGSSVTHFQSGVFFLSPPILLASSHKDKNTPPLSLTSFLLLGASRVISALVILSAACLSSSVSEAKPAQLIRGDLGRVPL